MSIKSKGRTYGRQIRKCTGLPFSVCMKIGKAVAQGMWCGDLTKKFPTYFKLHHWECGDKCCSGTSYTLTGPKGSINGQYGFSEEDIRKEYHFIAQKPRLNVAVIIPPPPDTIRTGPPKGMQA